MILTVIPNTSPTSGPVFEIILRLHHIGCVHKKVTILPGVLSPTSVYLVLVVLLKAVVSCCVVLGCFYAVLAHTSIFPIRVLQSVESEIP